MSVNLAANVSSFDTSGALKFIKDKYIRRNEMISTATFNDQLAKLISIFKAKNDDPLSLVSNVEFLKSFSNLIKYIQTLLHFVIH